MVFSFLGGKGGERPASPARPKFRALPLARAYWESLREEGGAIPARADIDPRGLATALDCVFVGERIGNGLIRLRIAGMSLTDVAGLDMKGLPISTLFIPEARLRLAQVVERVFTLPQVAEFHLDAERSIGRPGAGGAAAAVAACARPAARSTWCWAAWPPRARSAGRRAASASCARSRSGSSCRRPPPRRTQGELAFAEPPAPALLPAAAPAARPAAPAAGAFGRLTALDPGQGRPRRPVAGCAHHDRGWAR